MSDSIPKTIDEYIAQFPKKTQTVLNKIRKLCQKLAPEAKEVISYRMPAIKGKGILIYYAAWKEHIGIYPPIAGDSVLERDLSPYAGPKRNLQFPLDQPIPYDLIQRIILLRVAQDAAKAQAKRKSKSK